LRNTSFTDYTFMARIKVAIPEHVVFEAKLPVRVTDLNYGKHLGNDALLSMLHEARMQLLNYLGYTELEIGTASLIMADVAIEYKGESFYGDTLFIKMAFADISKYGFDITYHALNQNGKEIARAKTGMLCFNYQERKLMTLPEEVKSKIETKA
jgi:acyl-CoA thioester hydrolase